MSRKAYVKRSIRAFVEENSFLFSDFSNWYVGVTAKPKTRLRSHGNPDIWCWWEANSSREARDIERHFLDQGMLGNTGGGRYPRYVYIYKKHGPYS